MGCWVGSCISIIGPPTAVLSVLPAYILQLTDLPRLAVLDISDNLIPGDGYSSLTRLAALTRLPLSYNSHLPACLGQLTTLQALVSIKTV